ncbi:hypothetical protein R3P38DRAFT_2763348 [Favolaschia claudopus]|uniref:Uncharacterized protein n=1 Tax=Favolaschia claudopus TaxID=2862362 RepID=A0AAW0DCB2_9AGAR
MNCIFFHHSAAASFGREANCLATLATANIIETTVEASGVRCMQRAILGAGAANKQISEFHHSGYLPSLEDVMFVHWEIATLAMAMTTCFWSTASQRPRQRVASSRKASWMCCFGQEGEGVAEKITAQGLAFTRLWRRRQQQILVGGITAAPGHVKEAQRHIPDIGGSDVNVFD